MSENRNRELIRNVVESIGIQGEGSAARRIAAGILGERMGQESGSEDPEEGRWTGWAVGTVVPHEEKQNDFDAAPLARSSAAMIEAAGEPDPLAFFGRAVVDAKMDSKIVGTRRLARSSSSMIQTDPLARSSAPVIDPEAFVEADTLVDARDGIDDPTEPHEVLDTLGYDPEEIDDEIHGEVADDGGADAPSVSRKVRPRHRRRDRPRSKTIALKRLTREELRRGALENPPVEGVERPHTRAECSDAPRPCPWVACKHHLYLDINPRTGSIKINFPDLEPWELEHTCALDVADNGGLTLEEIGVVTNLTRERVRQVEVRGLLTLQARSRSLR